MPRVLVCGGREYADAAKVRVVLEALGRVADPVDLVVVHGAARGADRLAGQAARKLAYHVEAYPADWDGYGKRAGHIRNQQMLDTGIDLVVAFPGGRGTEDMIRRSRAAGVQVHIVPE